MDTADKNAVNRDTADSGAVDKNAVNRGAADNDAVESDAANIGVVKRDTVAFLYEESLYGRRKALAEWMGAWFEDKGYRVVYRVCRDGDMQAMETKGLRLLVVMDFAGFDFLAVNQEPWIGCQTCLCAALIYDNPIWYRQKLVRQIGWNTLIDCYDGHAAKYLETYFSDSLTNIRKRIPMVPFPESVLPLSERDTEVFLPASYEPSAEIEERLRGLDGIFRTLAWWLRQEMQRNRQISLTAALEAYLENIDFVCDREEFVTILEKMADVLLYVRAVQIEELMETLISCHAKITVCGPGWSESPYSRSSYVQILGGERGLPFQTMQEVMGRARFVVHPQTMFRDGVHERLLLAMANGAVVITEQLDALSEYFVDGTEILFYSEADQKEKIQGYLKETDVSYLQRLAEGGRRKASILSEREAYWNHIMQLGEI